MEQSGQLELQIWQETHLTQPTAHLTGEEPEKAAGELQLLAAIAVYTRVLHNIIFVELWYNNW